MFSTAQIALIKADILANPDLNSVPNSNVGSMEVARLYSLPSTLDVWRTEAPVSAIMDAINWPAFTPQEPADGTVIYTNRLLMIQTKQINLQSMLQGRATVDASKANLRAGLRDAVTALPAGASGASISAGGAAGANVMQALTRKATRLEKLFATGADVVTGPVTAKLLAYEGAISSDEVQTARES